MRIGSLVVAGIAAFGASSYFNIPITELPQYIMNNAQNFIPEIQSLFEQLVRDLKSDLKP